MNIVYVLESTTLCGGVKVVLEHVNELNKSGLDAAIASIDSYPEWINYKIPFKNFDNYQNLFDYFKNCHTVFILTFYRQIIYAKKLGIVDKCIHFCQGYEGDYKEAGPFIKEIKKAYNVEIKGITISQRLASYIKQKYPEKELFCVGQAIDHNLFFADSNKSLSEPFKILLIGSFYNSVKNIEIGLKALKILREYLNIYIIRVSLSETKQLEEKILPYIDEYHYLLPYELMPEIYRKSDIIIVPSNNGEGFGLPVIEAMACGTPPVLTKTDSFLSIDPKETSCIFVDINNAEEMADAAFNLLTNKDLFTKLKINGETLAKEYSYTKVIERLLFFLCKNYPALTAG